MGKFIDLTGLRFERLTVLKRVEEDYISPKGRHFPQWLCRCDCGNEKVIVGCCLRRGTTTSCGCYHKEKVIERRKKYNEWFIDKNKNIAVGTDNKGNKFTIDIQDYEKCKDYCWYVNNDGYAISHINGKHTRLHRFIMNASENVCIDHINGDPTDDRKSNLRVCNYQQNNMNHSIYKNNKSGHSGVSWCKASNKWIAHIGYKGKNINLGYFTNKEDAIKARQEAELKYFGEYRRTQ